MTGGREKASSLEASPQSFQRDRAKLSDREDLSLVNTMAFVKLSSCPKRRPDRISKAIVVGGCLELELELIRTTTERRAA